MRMKPEKYTIEDVLTWLETANGAEVSEVIQGVICRYRTLYPNWEIIISTMKTDEPKERRKQIKALKRMLNRYL